MRCALRRVARRSNAAPTDVALTASCCLASCAVPHAERHTGKAQWALRTCERRSAATNAGFDFPFAITSTCALETFALLWHRGGLGLVSARAGKYQLVVRTTTPGALPLPREGVPPGRALADEYRTEYRRGVK